MPSQPSVLPLVGGKGGIGGAGGCVRRRGSCRPQGAPVVHPPAVEPRQPLQLICPACVFPNPAGTHSAATKARLFFTMVYSLTFSVPTCGAVARGEGRGGGGSGGVLCASYLAQRPTPQARANPAQRPLAWAAPAPAARSMCNITNNNPHEHTRASQQESYSMVYSPTVRAHSCSALRGRRKECALGGGLRGPPGRTPAAQSGGRAAGPLLGAPPAASQTSRHRRRLPCLGVCCRSPWHVQPGASKPTQQQAGKQSLLNFQTPPWASEWTWGRCRGWGNGRWGRGWAALRWCSRGLAAVGGKSVGEGRHRLGGRADGGWREREASPSRGWLVPHVLSASSGGAGAGHLACSPCPQPRGTHR